MSLFEKCDFHIHTRLSPCAREEMTLPSILSTGAGRGVRYLGISDHVFPSTDVSILDAVRDELASLAKPMEVFQGCEADIIEVGRQTVGADTRSRLDYVALAANHFHCPWVSGPDWSDPEAAARHILKMFAYACSLSFADVIVHPMVMGSVYDTSCLDLLTDDDLLGPLELARQNGIAMEISRKAMMSRNLPFVLRFYGLCKRVGLKFSFGSDAHALIDAGQTRLLAPLVNEIGITDDDVWLPSKCGVPGSQGNGFATKH